MKIFIFVVYYLPSAVSCAKLIHDLALDFKRQGHEVTVVTTDEQAPTDFQVTEEAGIRIARVKAGKIKTASAPVRLWNECRLSRTIWGKGREFFRDNPCDLIIYYCPTIFFGPLVKRLKKMCLCPSYLILRDVFPQWTLDAGVLRKGPLYGYFKWREIVNYDASDFIGVESPANMAYFSSNGYDKKYRIEVLYNWAELSKEKYAPSDYRKKLGLQNKVVFFYGGNIGVAQDMDNIVRLAMNLREESDAFFLIVGDGSEVNRLRGVIKKEQLTNILIHPSVSQQNYQSMLDEFDIGLVSLDRNLKTFNFPGKMLGYMDHALPILASVNRGNDLRDILQTHEAGLACHNGEDEVFCNQALKLINNPALRMQMGINGRKLLENTFSVTTAASRILSHFTN